jgi:hypothetical protein
MANIAEAGLRKRKTLNSMYQPDRNLQEPQLPGTFALMVIERASTMH